MGYWQSYCINVLKPFISVKKIDYGYIGIGIFIVKYRRYQKRLCLKYTLQFLLGRGDFLKKKIPRYVSEGSKMNCQKYCFQKISETFFHPGRKKKLLKNVKHFVLHVSEHYKLF